MRLQVRLSKTPHCRAKKTREVKIAAFSVNAGNYGTQEAMAGTGIEPVTSAFSEPRSTN